MRPATVLAAHTGTGNKQYLLIEGLCVMQLLVCNHINSRNSAIFEVKEFVHEKWNYARL